MYGQQVIEQISLSPQGLDHKSGQNPALTSGFWSIIQIKSVNYDGLPHACSPWVAGFMINARRADIPRSRFDLLYCVNIAEIEEGN